MFIKVLLLVFMLALNFIISWANASYVGRYWSESKAVGGSFRVSIVIGYIMAIAGFTMVYGYILLLISPILLQLAKDIAETITIIATINVKIFFVFINSTSFQRSFPSSLIVQSSL